jgi:2'-5' RNA ligase
VAVDLPDPVQRAVATLCHGLPGVRWLPPEQLHLTIRFIGEVDDARLAAIRQGLTGTLPAPFACRLQGVGRFPARGSPRVIWVGVQAEAGLMCLAETVEARLQALGISPEERPFSPHITLTRLKDLHRATVNAYLADHAQFHSEWFTVRAYHLYASLLTPKGAIHTLVH